MAALAHGALNNWGQYAFKYMEKGGEPNDMVVLAAGGLAVLAVGGLLLEYGYPSAPAVSAASQSASAAATR